ncbi:MAG TPA: formylglycine-generating enzyme family protein [Candidatus Brocadiia bacterium]|nr:formylglycine-generating enzyme family protein [Candidatus Brocadiia bacterium]
MRIRKLEIAVLLALILCAFGVTRAEPPSQPTTVKTKTGVQMVLLPGGAFVMGQEGGEVDETPHEVTVSPFYIDKCEVTQEDYERVMSDNPSKIKNRKNPVEQVRWSDAVRYCNERSKLEGFEPAYDLKTWTCRFEADGYRLPTEAEWEYAARAGSKTPFSFGESDAPLKMFAWFKDNAGGKPHPVAQRKPNPWGLYDMHGNLWEWCNDFYGVDYYAGSPKNDPRGPENGEKKVLRGGCWNSNPDACRSAYRYNESPAYADACFGYDIYGFRCVRKYDGNQP